MASTGGRLLLVCVLSLALLHLAACDKMPSGESSSSSSSQEPRVRIRDAWEWTAEGRVEILHNGVWGGVCGNGWDTVDALTVCRELGYVTGYAYGIGGMLRNAPVWLDHVACVPGVHTRLEDCGSDGWGVHSCGPDSTMAAAWCSKTELPPSPPRTPTWPPLPPPPPPKPPNPPKARGINLALRRPAYTSSATNGAPPSVAVDGDTISPPTVAPNNLFASYGSIDWATGQKGPAWLSVDLGGVFHITTIQIYAGTWSPTGLYQTEVRVGNTSITSDADLSVMDANTLVWTFSGYAGGIPDVYTKHLTQPVTGRWVTVKTGIPEGENVPMPILELKELEVYGMPAASWSSYSRYYKAVQQGLPRWAQSWRGLRDVLVKIYRWPF